MYSLFRNRFISSAAFCRRRGRPVAPAMPLERLEPRLALAGDMASRPLLEQATTLVMDSSIGPNPVIMSKSQIVGNDVKSFVISHVSEGSVVEKWDAATETWVDVSTRPTSSNPQELMRLLSNRLIQEGDRLQWRPKSGFDVAAQRGFQMINWDDGSEFIAPNPEVVPGLQNPSIVSTGAGELTAFWEAPSAGDASITSQVIGLIADLGGDRGAGTTFYYNIGSQGGGYTPVDSLGPGASTVADLVRSWNPTDILQIGDQLYTVGGSTLADSSIGRHFNDFMAPYPSPYYLEGDYLSIGGNAVSSGQKTWPYNLYDFPSGFPNPTTGETGGSPDGRNHYWGTVGDHEYGEAIGFGQVGVTPYDFEGNDIGAPLAPSSTATPRATIEYAMPWLLDPSLLGADSSRVNIGSVDITGNSGTYYSITFGEQANGHPLLEFFNLDTQRLDINAGLQDWNPSGTRTQNPDGSWSNAVQMDVDYSITYDPTNPDQAPLPGTTTDPINAYAQYTWLQTSLAASNAKWKIITGHHPVYTSGQWGSQQPNDHMSLPYVQKLLKALPTGSFDAWYNGHDHYYERVLEQNGDGIGQGIPFITNGNSGRILYAKGQVPYGTSVYTPTSPGTSNAAVIDELLPSDPASVGSSGLGQDGNANTAGFSPGLYAYGFGGTRMEFDNNFLFFNYQQAPMVDPAIANHLPDGKAPQDGFASTTASDWIPNPDGDFSGLPDLAYFGIEVTNGVVTDVQIVNGGSGYMSSKGGNHTVIGFNIYGNNTDLMQPWLNTAQVDLTFSDGQLTEIALTDGGSDYDLAVGAALSSNIETSISFQPDPSNEWQSLRVPLNYRLSESTYLIRDNNNSDYQDWYLITDTAISAASLHEGLHGGLSFSVAPSSERAREILASQAITPGYSGSGQQAKYGMPQQGEITVVDSTGTTIGTGTITSGTASIEFNAVAAPGPVHVSFAGDHQSSYLTNFKGSNSSLDLDYGDWDSRISSNGTEILFTEDVRLSATRTDQGGGTVSFGLTATADQTPILILQNASAANAQALTASAVFTTSGDNNWLASEGKSQGSSALSQLLQAGSYTPFAATENGTVLTVESISTANNTIDVNFSDGISVRYAGLGTGTASSLPGTGSISVTVQRLSSNANGVAFYEANAVTGAIQVGAKTLLPSQAGYLDAALQLATDAGLRLSAGDLPDVGTTETITGLNLKAGTNYGVLLLHQDRADDLSSSYATANQEFAVQMQSFAAPKRGVIFGIEDLRKDHQNYDGDFNDLIVTFAGSDFNID